MKKYLFLFTIWLICHHSYSQSIKLTPEEYFNKGLLKLQDSDKLIAREASKDFDLAIAGKPGWGDAYYYSAKASMSLGEEVSVENISSFLISKDDWHYDPGKLDKTVLDKFINQFAENKNNKINEANIRGWQKVVKKLDSALLYRTAFLDDAIYLQAIASFSAKDYHLSIQQFLHTLKKNNSDPALILLLGQAYLRDGQYAEAVNQFNNFIKNNLSAYVGYFYRGNALLFQKKYKEAIVDYKAALTRKEYAKIYNNLGIAYLQLNDESKACDSFTMANSLGIRQLDFYLYKYCGHSGDFEEIEEETVEDGWVTRRVEVAPKEYPLEIRIN